MLRLAVTLFCLLLLGTQHVAAQVAAPAPAVAPAQLPAPPVEDAAARLEKMVGTLGEYTAVITRGEETLTAKMLQRPLQRWADKNSRDGIVVAYTPRPRARPVVIAHYQEHQDGATFGEFSAVTSEPFELMRGERLIWSPLARYSDFEEIESNAQPSDDAATRLKQMRQLLDRFSAVDAHGWKEQDIEDHQLYFVKKPMLRYGPDEDIVDGAVYIGQWTTDPEMALLIEAYRADDGLKWRYRPVELSIYQLTVRYGDKIVWEKPRELIFTNETSRHYAGPIR